MKPRFFKTNHDKPCWGFVEKDLTVMKIDKNKSITIYVKRDEIKYHSPLWDENTINIWLKERKILEIPASEACFL